MWDIMGDIASDVTNYILNTFIAYFKFHVVAL